MLREVTANNEACSPLCWGEDTRDVRVTKLIAQSLLGGKEIVHNFDNKFALTEIKLMQIEKDMYKIFFKFSFSAQIKLVFSQSGAVRTI